MNMHQSSPFFIFDGGEGAGKSTAIKEVAALLVQGGYQVVRSREPGGTPNAEKIRELLLSPQGALLARKEQLKLFFEARRIHMQELIFPALDRGSIPLLDRGDSATYGYQVFAQDGPDLRELFWRERAMVYDRYVPTCYLIFDGRPEVFLKRVSQRHGESNHFDTRKLEFHQRVREGLLEFARQPGITARIIDAEQDPGAIIAQVTNVIKEFLPE